MPLYFFSHLLAWVFRSICWFVPWWKARCDAWKSHRIRVFVCVAVASAEWLITLLPKPNSVPTSSALSCIKPGCDGCHCSWYKEIGRELKIFSFFPGGAERRALVSVEQWMKIFRARKKKSGGRKLTFTCHLRHGHPAVAEQIYSWKLIFIHIRAANSHFHDIVRAQARGSFISSL